MGTMTRMLGGAAMMVGLTLGLVPVAAAQAPAAGTVTRVEGTAAVARTAIPRPTPLKTRDSLYLRDLLTTGEQSRAQLLLGGKATVTMRERSALRITEDPGVSTVEMTDGKLKLAVLKDRMKAGERVEVKTPNAVTAVRGTVVIVEVVRTPSGIASVVTVLIGSVEVTRFDPATGRPTGTPLVVNALQQTVVDGVKPPSAPQAIPRAEGERLEASFAFGLKPAATADADLLKRQVEQAASDAAKLPPAGAGGRLQPGAPGAGPGLSGDDIRSRSGVVTPPTGSGPPTRGN